MAKARRKRLTILIGSLAFGLLGFSFGLTGVIQGYLDSLRAILSFSAAISIFAIDYYILNLEWKLHRKQIKSSEKLPAEQRLPRGSLFLGSILVELINLAISVVTFPAIFRALIWFPALLILPGFLLLLVIKEGVGNTQTLMVEGFFLSTIIAVLLTAFMLMLSITITSVAYAGMAFLVVLALAVFGYVKGIKPRLESDFLILGLTFTSYLGLLLFFSSIPRFFTPDETTYIFSARLGLLNGIVAPFGISPSKNIFTTSIDGRYFWIYLLTSFIGSTGLPAQEAGLLGVGFIVMTALVSSLFMETKELRRAVFMIVLISPILLSFSGSVLNDLATAFYTALAVLFFIKSVSSSDGKISLDIGNLVFSITASIILVLLKPNLLIFGVMWIVIVVTIARFRLYDAGQRQRLLAVALILPVLVYELVLDIPYFIAVWILRDSALGSIFGKFLVVSPAETLAGLFVAPWWHPNATTLFTHSSLDFVDYFYRLLMPESSSLVLASVVLALPLFFFSKTIRREIRNTVLISLVILSIALFYVVGLRLASISDVGRYPIALVPIWTPLALTVLKNIKSSPSMSKIFPVVLTALILLWANIWLSFQAGGIYVGYGVFSRVMSIDVIMLELLFLTIILGLPLFLNQLRVHGALPRVANPAPRKLKTENLVFWLILALVFSNGIYYTSVVLSNSLIYQDRGLSEVAASMSNLSSNGALVFANNYIYMRPYVSDQTLQRGLLLPPPATENEFQNLLETAPNGSMILISNDTSTNYYEYGSSYLAKYQYSDVITPRTPEIAKLPLVNLTRPFVRMPFDDANASTVPDHSGLANNGVNYGAIPVSGYYGQALRFNGTGYVSILSNANLNVQNQISISFLAIIQAAEPLTGHMILSKGYAGSSSGGSYDVFVWNQQLYFELGAVGYASIPAIPYLGSWHQFVLNYDGQKMEIFVDGVLRTTQLANGSIQSSSYNLEIGRDSQRHYDTFVGILDELQIANKSLGSIALARSYFKHFATQTEELLTNGIFVHFFEIINEKTATQPSGVSVEDSKITLDPNLTLHLEVLVHTLSSSNVTVLLATDAFMKVYLEPVIAGENALQYSFEYGTGTGGGLYWQHFDQTRIVVFDNRGKMIYNHFLIYQDPKIESGIMLAYSAGVLLIFSLLSIIRRRKP